MVNTVKYYAIKLKEAPVNEIGRLTMLLLNDMETIVTNVRNYQELENNATIDFIIVPSRRNKHTANDRF